MLDEAETAPPGTHVEHGVVADVVYLGVVTRYRIELDGGGQLVAVRQNLETAAADALEARGRRARVAWRPDQAFRVGADQPGPAHRRLIISNSMSHSKRKRGNMNIRLFSGEGPRALPPPSPSPLPLLTGWRRGAASAAQRPRRTRRRRHLDPADPEHDAAASRSAKVRASST